MTPKLRKLQMIMISFYSPTICPFVSLQKFKGFQPKVSATAVLKSPESIDFNYTYTYTETPEFPTDVEHHNFNQLTFVQNALSTTNETYETGIQRHAFSVNNNLEWCDFDRRFGEHFNENFVRPLNLEQKFYFAMMTHPQNYVTVVAGSTGSGKTLVALQAGLELVSEGIVEGIVYARNTITSNDQQAELGLSKRG